MNDEVANTKLDFKAADEQGYKHLFDSIFIIFQSIELIYDENGNAIDYCFRKVNAAFEKFAQKKSTALVGKRATDIFGTVEGYLVKMYERVDKTEIPEQFEDYRTEANTYCQISAWKTGQGQIAIIFIDRTEHKRVELELRKNEEDANERNRLKSAFLVNMSHEIRTPLNGILGFASLLRNKELSPGEREEYIHIINESANRMLDTINDIIDISKIAAGQMKLVHSLTNLNDQIVCLHNLFKDQAETKGLQLIHQCALNRNKATIYTDREKVFSIVSILLKNALIHTKTGSIAFGYQKKGDFIEFYVKDSGTGIKKEVLDNIFKPVMQTENYDTKVTEYSGMGLAICQQYVEMFGGKIRVKSKLGAGSIFSFTIPHQIENPMELSVNKEVNKVDAQAITNKLTIVVAEDDEISNSLLSKMLQQKRHRVLNAFDGKKAVDLCRIHNDIGLIFMDIRMTKLNGYQAAEQIRTFNSDVIIIAQTAFSLEGDREKALAAGCNDYLSKPIDQTKLFQLIDRYFPN